MEFAPESRKRPIFPRYVPWMVYAGRDRRACEFYFTVPNRPGELMKTLEVFARHGINILNIGGHSMPEWDRAPIFVFADLTGAEGRLEDVERELREVSGSEVYCKRSVAGGFMIDEFAFPLYALPGVRSVLLLGSDFVSMVRGFYERLGNMAAVFLYHLAYSGGASLASYLSEKLGLKGRELIVEALKMYQAGGWGLVELVECDPDSLDVALRIHGCIECEGMRGSRKPLSHFVRGHLSGFLSGLLNAKVRAVERRCIAAGDPYCEFYLEEV